MVWRLHQAVSTRFQAVSVLHQAVRLRFQAVAILLQRVQAVHPFTLIHLYVIKSYPVDFIYLKDFQKAIAKVSISIILLKVGIYMEKLSVRTISNKLVEFLKSKARPLEKALFEFEFEDGSREQVLEELKGLSK